MLVIFGVGVAVAVAVGGAYFQPDKRITISKSYTVSELTGIISWRILK